MGLDFRISRDLPQLLYDRLLAPLRPTFEIFKGCLLVFFGSFLGQNGLMVRDRNLETFLIIDGRGSLPASACTNLFLINQRSKPWL